MSKSVQTFDWECIELKRQTCKQNLHIWTNFTMGSGVWVYVNLQIPVTFSNSFVPAPRMLREQEPMKSDLVG